VRGSCCSEQYRLKRVAALIEALGKGGAAVDDAAGLTAGAKTELRGGARALAGIASLGYLGEELVAGRGLHRHGHDVARVRYYRVTTGVGPRYLLVHLTAEGLVTDYDVVER
jgi:hypothetical protein